MRIGRAEIAGLLLALASIASCAHPPAESLEYIGNATIDEQGVLSLDLVSYERGSVAHGLAVYRPGDEYYDEVLRHVGPIRPGETKPVRPWPATR